MQNTGLTNMGFESGDLTGWTVGDVIDSVDVTGADAYTSPCVFTYDYTGFDEFRFDVEVTDPTTGEVLAA